MKKVLLGALAVLLSVGANTAIAQVTAGVDAKINNISVNRGQYFGGVDDGVVIGLTQITNRFGTTNVALANDFETECNHFVIIGEPSSGIEAALFAIAVAAQNADDKVSVGLIKEPGDTYCTVSNIVRHSY